MNRKYFNFLILTIFFNYTLLAAEDERSQLAILEYNYKLTQLGAIENEIADIKNKIFYAKNYESVEEFTQWDLKFFARVLSDEEKSVYCLSGQFKLKDVLSFLSQKLCVYGKLKRIYQQELTRVSSPSSTMASSFFDSGCEIYQAENKSQKAVIQELETELKEVYQRYKSVYSVAKEQLVVLNEMLVDRGQKKIRLSQKQELKLTEDRKIFNEKVLSFLSDKLKFFQKALVEIYRFKESLIQKNNELQKESISMGDLSSSEANQIHAAQTGKRKRHSEIVTRHSFLSYTGEQESDLTKEPLEELPIVENCFEFNHDDIE